MEIKTAKYQDFGDILKLQPLAYKSEGQIYDDFRIPPPLQTEEEIKTEFSEKLFLKAIDEHGIRTITTKTTVRDIKKNTPQSTSPAFSCCFGQSRTNSNNSFTDASSSMHFRHHRSISHSSRDLWNPLILQ
jgi:hypothetical protein